MKKKEKESRSLPFVSFESYHRMRKERFVRVYVCVCINRHIHIHIYIYKYRYIIYIYSCKYAYIYVHICTFTCIPRKKNKNNNQQIIWKLFEVIHISILELFWSAFSLSCLLLFSSYNFHVISFSLSLYFSLFLFHSTHHSFSYFLPNKVFLIFFFLYICTYKIYEGAVHSWTSQSLKTLYKERRKNKRMRRQEGLFYNDTSVREKGNIGK